MSEHILMTTVIHCDFYFPQLILPTIPKNTFQLFMSFETGFFLESWSVNVPVSQVLWVNFVKCALNKVDVETKYRLSVGLISI